MWADAQRDGRPATCSVSARGYDQTSCKVWLDSSERRRCSNKAKTLNLLKFAGVPQTTESISAISGLKFTILWGHVGRYCCLTCLFPIIDICLSCEDITRQSCAGGDFLHPVFSASRVQHISDLHSKFAVRPHHVWKYGRHPICNGWD